MPSRITWTLAAWEDYQYWQGQDRKTLKSTIPIALYIAWMGAIW